MDELGELGGHVTKRGIERIFSPWTRCQQLVQFYFLWEVMQWSGFRILEICSKVTAGVWESEIWMVVPPASAERRSLLPTLHPPVTASAVDQFVRHPSASSLHGAFLAALPNHVLSSGLPPPERPPYPDDLVPLASENEPTTAQCLTSLDSPWVH